jgi:hypothetical protein
MRCTLRAAALLVGLMALGCHHEKYNMRPKKVEEYILPPNEKRYNEPDTAPFRPQRQPKEEPNAASRPGKGGSGGMGPGGF